MRRKIARQVLSNTCNKRLAKCVGVLQRFAADRFAALYVRQGWCNLIVRVNEELAQLSPSYVLEQCKWNFGSRRYDAHPAVYEHTDQDRLVIGSA